MEMSGAAGKGEGAGDKRGGSSHAGAFFFVICYYYTNEYLRTQCVTNLCETRTVAIYNRKHMNLKITTYKVVFQTVEINYILSRRKFQYLL